MQPTKKLHIHANDKLDLSVYLKRRDFTLAFIHTQLSCIM